MDKIRKVLGDNIRFYRLQRGLTQEELAENMRVESGYVSKVERAQINVSIAYVQKFSDALEVKVSQLFQENS